MRKALASLVARFTWGTTMRWLLVTLALFWYGIFAVFVIGVPLLCVYVLVSMVV